MLKISDFSKIAQVSTRTLRYYDDLNLLKPQVIDPESGYRYYAIGQLTQLNRILALKGLGFGLDQIASLLDTQVSSEQMQAYLRQQEREIEARILEDAERLRRVRERLQQIQHEKDPILIDVVLKTGEAQPAIGNRLIVPTQSDLMFFCNHMLAELYRWLRQHRIPYTATQLILYHGEEYSETDLDTEVVILLPSMPKSIPPLPHNAIHLFELPAVQTLATTTFQGRLQEGSKAVLELIRWCEKNGYVLAEGLTMLREVHLLENIDESRPIPMEGLIEFQLPVERRSS
jgi:DNA-binding transcriptional MerR regulator